jgi:hypothetical protein
MEFVFEKMYIDEDDQLFTDLVLIICDEENGPLNLLLEWMKISGVDSAITKSTILAFNNAFDQNCFTLNEYLRDNVKFKLGLKAILDLSKDTQLLTYAGSCLGQLFELCDDETV